MRAIVGSPLIVVPRTSATTRAGEAKQSADAAPPSRRAGAPPAPGVAAHAGEHLVAPLVRAQEPVARAGDAQVGIGRRLVALDEAAVDQHLDDRRVLLLEPQGRDLAPIEVLLALLHGAETPRLD